MLGGGERSGQTGMTLCGFSVRASETDVGNSVRSASCADGPAQLERRTMKGRSRWSAMQEMPPKCRPRRHGGVPEYSLFVAPRAQISLVPLRAAVLRRFESF